VTWPHTTYNVIIVNRLYLQLAINIATAILGTHGPITAEKDKPKPVPKL